MSRSTLLRLLSATAIVGALTLPALVGAAYAAPGDDAPAPPASQATPPAPPPPAAEAPNVPPPPAAGTPDHMNPDHMKMGAADHGGWHGHRGRGDMAARVFKLLDANGDGKISQDEFAAAGQHLFNAADGNHDSILTPRELRRGGRIARQQMSGRGMIALDTNHDGTISKDEFMAFPARIFARLDKNHDGKLDAGEIAAAQQARMTRMRHMMQRMQEGQDHRGGPPWQDDDGHRGHWGHGLGPHHWGHGPSQGHGGDHRWGADHGDASRDGAMKRPDAGGRMMAMFLRRADTDHDGALSKAEAEAANTALFKRLDANHDGSISPDELAKAAAWIRHHRDGGPQGGGER